MPRVFFDQVLVAAPRRRSRPWMTAGSIVVHGVLLAALIVVPLVASVQIPAVQTPLPPFAMLAATVPQPEPPAPAPPNTAPVTSTAPTVPLEAPDRVYPEVEPPPVARGLAAPGGIPGVSGGTGVVGGLPTVGAPGGLGEPPPPPQPPAPRRVGGVIEAPTRVTYAAPAYPAIAQSARIEGTVVLEATINAQGVVETVTVLRSIPMLDRAAVEAVRQWRYTPTRLNGQAIPVIMTVTVTFSLR